MNPTALAQLIASRRTVRAFDRTKDVPRDALIRILEAGQWAPQSVYATQAPRLIACRGEARDPLVEQALRDHTVLRYVRHMYERSALGEDESWRNLATAFGKTLGEAPVVVAALVEHDEHRIRIDHNFGAAWAAAQNMLLQATAEGVDSGIVTLSSAKARIGVIEHLGFEPHDWSLAWLMNLGFGLEAPQAALRDSTAWEIRP